MILARRLKMASLINYRAYKNFGHKRQPVPTITFLWQGFLTFTFLGLCIEWKRVARFVFGHEDGESYIQSTENPNSINK